MTAKKETSEYSSSAALRALAGLVAATWLFGIVLAAASACQAETPKEQQARFAKEFNTSLKAGPDDYQARKWFIAAQVADIAITTYIIEQGCGVEANPLLSWAGKDDSAAIALVATALSYAQYRLIRAFTRAASAGHDRRNVWRGANARWAPVAWNAYVLAESC